MWSEEICEMWLWIVRFSFLSWAKRRVNRIELARSSTYGTFGTCSDWSGPFSLQLRCVRPSTHRVRPVVKRFGDGLTRLFFFQQTVSQICSFISKCVRSTALFLIYEFFFTLTILALIALRYRMSGFAIWWYSLRTYVYLYVSLPVRPNV